jgi:predicted lipoprotein with Yx(FWY)xxD motif
MLRRFVVPVAALAAAGAVVLSACGTSTTAGSSGPDTAGRGVEQTLSLLSGTAEANNAKRGTGDWAKGSDGTLNSAKRSVAERWVQLAAGRAGELDPVVLNGAGLTLYRFDNDTANPSKSTCDGDCARTWPPVTVAKGGRIFVDGVPESAVGVVKRADGRLQVTIGGWPVYRFANDTQPGDTLGQGVGGTWFGVTPDGRKAGTGNDNPDNSGQEIPDNGNTGQDSPAQDSPAQDDGASKATSAVLFDDADFSDNGPSQGLAGPGCQNTARPDVASSISASGSLKLWSEANCKGRSLVVDGDVADLAEFDFDNTTASIFFG